MGRFLRKDDIRDLRTGIDGAFGLGDSLLPHGSRVEGFSTKEGEVFVVDNEPTLFARDDGTIFPLLVYVLKSDLQLPHVAVDLRAVPHICNGADIFRPGVRNIDPDIKTDQLLLVTDERNLKPLCVGRSLMDAKTMQQMTQGKVVRNMHYVGDSVWDFSKSLEKRLSRKD